MDMEMPFFFPVLTVHSDLFDQMDRTKMVTDRAKLLSASTHVYVRDRNSTLKTETGSVVKMGLPELPETF